MQGQLSTGEHSLVQSPALKVYGGEQQETASVVRLTAPQLHAQLL